MWWRFDINKAVRALRNNQLIAYPTEGVYGLGCRLNALDTIDRIINLKQRPKDAGFVVIGSSFEQLSKLMSSTLHEDARKRLLRDWPGPTTFIVPASRTLPWLVTGGRKTVALRQTAHPVAKALCKKLGEPIISTSVNVRDDEPARSAKAVKAMFPNQIDFVLQGPLGSLKGPTEIRDLWSDEIIRSR
ncbi:MAG: threonylcarbamoyl-AMP synthase [Gammaproteobacteria bacterium]|nr:threonylcarbamoyl-AMP synthase [Gammaproteobacteria bacterium]